MDHQMRCSVAGPAALAAITALGSGIAAPTAAVQNRTAVSVAVVSGPTVVAVGDIACRPGGAVTATTCQQAATALLTRSYDPTYVFPLGDTQYENGSLYDFTHSYDRSWGGALKAITKPVPGNHEYGTPGASGYFTYFQDQQPGGAGYYAFNVENWRIYALNSNCTIIDCDSQIRWMNRDMGNHPRTCSAIMMHHPRFSSGVHGSEAGIQRFWRVAYKHHADIALAGHDHDYERFRRMNPSGAAAADGLFSFVSGAGGKSLYPFGAAVSGSRARVNHAPGVLALTLGRTRFAFEYKTVDGIVMDSGVRNCR